MLYKLFIGAIVIGSVILYYKFEQKYNKDLLNSDLTFEQQITYLKLLKNHIGDSKWKILDDYNVILEFTNPKNYSIKIESYPRLITIQKDENVINTYEYTNDKFENEKIWNKIEDDMKEYCNN
jgi:hypothetical protein